VDKEPLINVVLVNPEIPQNTGNIIRLCANAGARLHLVEPLGFQLNDAKLRRAALDYSDLVDVVSHKSIDSVFDIIDTTTMYATVINSPVAYTDQVFQRGDTIIFGAESTGLSDVVLSRLSSQNQLAIPMTPANRSLNLSNAVAIVVYEMWRQLEFIEADLSHKLRGTYFS
jgi:tRNA (cytidine/uridine-2'-O-)-methyltransferase